MNIPNNNNEIKCTEEDFKRLRDQLFRMLICGESGTGETNTWIHMLLKPLIYYDKTYLYAKHLEHGKL